MTDNKIFNDCTVLLLEDDQWLYNEETGELDLSSVFDWNILALVLDDLYMKHNWHYCIEPGCVEMARYTEDDVLPDKFLYADKSPDLLENTVDAIMQVYKIIYSFKFDQDGQDRPDKTGTSETTRESTGYPEDRMLSQ